MEEQQKQQKNCKFGISCKYIDKCRYFHPEQINQEKINKNNNNFDQPQYQQQQNIQYNALQKKPNQSLKDFYQQMLQKNDQQTQKAKIIESYKPGYSETQSDNLQNKLYYNQQQQQQNNENLEESKEQNQKLQQYEQEKEKQFEQEYLEQLMTIAKQQNLNQKVKIGIDFGGVICGSDPKAKPDPNEDTMFGPNYLQTSMIPDAFEGVKFLINKFGSENIFIVSKCGANVQRKSTEWMQHHNIQEKTGLLEKNIFFCKERPQKAPICAENNINFFIDDREDVFQHMHKSIIKFKFPSARDKQAGKNKAFNRVNGWKQLIDIFKFINLV